MEYYYVVLGSEWDLYKMSYSDIASSEKATYYAGLSSIYGNKLAKYLNSVLIRVTGIPIGRYLLKPLYRKLKRIKSPICFILFGNWVEYEVSIKYLDHLKILFPNSRYVWFMQDLVDTHPRIKSRINQLIHKFNLVLSFDYSDCKKYNLIYYPLVFSSVELNQGDIKDCDVYFLGKAKNRLPEIIKTYEFLKSKGLKVDFYLVGVPKEQQVYADQIHYIKGMSYIDNLRHIKGCKCALEIMQKGGSGYTQRVSEILFFNKMIITNNQYLKQAPFYDSSNMNIIDDSFSID
ncbi:MAG: hypothetical protein K2H01_06095, partial [Ruminococcus sp.]|nr:hypothetical protein [Ruminococcus sp.]